MNLNWNDETILSSDVSETETVKENIQSQKYRRRSFLKLEPSICEVDTSFSTINLCDNEGCVKSTSKRRKRSVSKRKSITAEPKMMEDLDSSMLNASLMNDSVIEITDGIDELKDNSQLRNAPKKSFLMFKEDTLKDTSFSEQVLSYDLQSIEEEGVANVSCSDFNILNSTINEESQNPVNLNLSIQTEDDMEDESLSVMNVTCGDFSILDKLGEDDVAKENKEKPKLRRSLRKKIQPLNTSIQIVGTTQIPTLSESYSDIEKYYLCKKFKRLPNTLETIFEEPIQKNNKDMYVSTRKFNRIIKFGVNSGIANSLKIKKRITKVNKLASSTKFLKRKKVSMNRLLKTLSSLEELE